MPEVAYNVSLLFPTDNQDEPGVMNVKVMAPLKQSKLTIVVEVDAFTTISDNIESIMQCVQDGICDRIYTDAKSEINVFFDCAAHSDEFPGSKYIKLIYDGDNHSFEKADVIEY